MYKIKRKYPHRQSERLDKASNICLGGRSLERHSVFVDDKKFAKFNELIAKVVDRHRHHRHVRFLGDFRRPRFRRQENMNAKRDVNSDKYMQAVLEQIKQELNEIKGGEAHNLNIHCHNQSVTRTIKEQHRKESLSSTTDRPVEHSNNSGERAVVQLGSEVQICGRIHFITSGCQ